MNLVLVQLDMAWEDKRESLARASRLLERESIAPGSLIVLPEMFSTGFSMNVAGIAEGEERPAERFLADTARRLSSYALGGVVIRGEDGRGRNEAVLFDPGGAEIARYAKMQPFSLGGEKHHYIAGAAPVVVPCGGFRLSPFICYDLRFPELFRLAVRRGAQLFIVIASWPSPRVHHWQTLLQARAIENLAFVAGVNRAGADPYHRYPGRSMVVDPHGAVLAEAGDEAGTMTVSIDVGEVEEWRREFPALEDIRPEVWSA